MLGVISGFDPFTGNLRFCWFSVAHTVMQVWVRRHKGTESYIGILVST